MTRDERSLLLFFECAFVDHGGLLDTQHMNSDDMQTAARWSESGYIRFERVCAKDRCLTRKNYCVWLSEKAMHDAHSERSAHALRCWEKRRIRTVSEYHSEPVAS
ncbi:bacteriophage protein [Roseibium sp. TrichSKD4]|uniref:hypothetical protein n=1 Tax=Roseibium sp. TrichSKD4 TaxID=744980 RepID=UPI0001E563F8|nr:hypothetical protein [Roseibium sp. TrichSKD4]EFO32584.1 bacteriophage protein [Roseibium sp. TrichSKD4]EFO33942.1 bacteriophage protein [Roseibium sp. TrichSKD4]